MRISHRLLGLILSLLVGNPSARSMSYGENKDFSRAKLDAWLGRIDGAENAKIEGADNEAIRRVFPNDNFYSVRFMRYPRSQLVPRPLKLENLILVRSSGTVENIADLCALKKFVQMELPLIRDDVQAKDVSLACLRLAEVFYQDGFVKFVASEDSVAVTHREGFLIVTGKSRVIKGGRGEIVSKLTFQSSGKIDEVELGGKVRPDARNR